MTNFDRIKQMSIKELAIFLGCLWSDSDDHIRVISGDVVFGSFSDIEEWLEREVAKNDQA